MRKEKTILEDGRYLIYYTFGKRRKRSVRGKTANSKFQIPNSQFETPSSANRRNG